MARTPTARDRRAAPGASEAVRYRSLAQTSRRRRVRRRPLWPIAMLTVGALVISFVGWRFASGFDINTLVANAINVLPAAEPSTLEIEQQSISTSTAPIIEGLPEFTSQPQQLLQGRIPSFALVAGSQVQVKLNGAVVATVPVDAQGHFAASLNLRDGGNAIETSLVRGAESSATSAWAVTVDRTKPTVTLSRPRDADVVDGKAILVEGKTEPNVTVRVNDRVVTPNPEGEFSESFSANPGPLTVQVVARDRAGNETILRVPVTAKAPDATTTGAALAVSLNKSQVKTGEGVTATMTLTNAGIPAADVSVTLQVGVVTIGTARTDAFGRASIGFAAPTTDGTISVVVLGGGATGSAILTVTK